MTELQHSSLRDLIPRHKSDFERVHAAVERGHPDIAPVLPDLLEWIRDMNWPIAPGVADILASVGEPMIPAIMDAFNSREPLWHTLRVGYVVGPNGRIKERMEPFLRGILRCEPESEDDRWPHEQIILTYGRGGPRAETSA